MTTYDSALLSTVEIMEKVSYAPDGAIRARTVN